MTCYIVVAADFVVVPLKACSVEAVLAGILEVLEVPADT